jgi:predicted peroxiredoxin
MLFVGTHGPESPTHAVLPFLQAQGALEEGHEAEVLVVGDAVVLV